MLRVLTGRRVAARRGFTIAELLVAMALITLIMSILSQAFVEGLETFRQLKGIGDIQESLRTAAFQLRSDVLATGDLANDFIDNTRRTGTPDRSAAGDLRVRYELICAAALDLEDGLRDVESQTTNPAARRLMDRILDALAGVKWGACVMVAL